VLEHYVLLARQLVGRHGLHRRSRLLFRISQVTVEPDDEAVDMYNVPIEEGALILQL
jgi:hypothetical protein